MPPDTLPSQAQQWHPKSPSVNGQGVSEKCKVGAYVLTKLFFDHQSQFTELDKGGHCRRGGASFRLVFLMHA